MLLDIYIIMSIFMKSPHTKYLINGKFFGLEYTTTLSSTWSKKTLVIDPIEVHIGHLKRVRR